MAGMKANADCLTSFTVFDTELHLLQLSIFLLNFTIRYF